MLKVLFLMFVLVGCAESKIEEAVIISESDVEGLELAKIANNGVRLSFNQSYFKSKEVGGFEVRWNGQHQGYFLLKDNLVLPAEGDMILTLNWMDESMTFVKGSSTHHLKGLQ